MKKSKRALSRVRGVYSWKESRRHAVRMARFMDAGIYLVTSQTLSMGRSTEKIVRDAVKAGARLIQLREKEMTDKEFYCLAVSVRKITDRARALLIINDRPDIAIAVGADGVHLGQDDLPISLVRKMAPDLIIGASTHSISEAREAEKQGASYINIGPLFPTKSKEVGGKFLGIKGLRRVISSGVKIPFTVMGGIKKKHIPELAGLGVRTIAVITAVTAARNPGKGFAEILRHFRDKSGE